MQAVAQAMGPLSMAVRQLGALLEAREVTRGLRAAPSRGRIVLSRDWQADLSAEPEPDPRFRLTPLNGGRFGLSLYRRNRWERLPFQGTLEELVEIMSTTLAHWAAQF